MLSHILYCVKYIFEVKKSSNIIFVQCQVKGQVEVLCPIQQPGSYCEILPTFSFVGVEPTQK